MSRRSRPIRTTASSTGTRPPNRRRTRRRTSSGWPRAWARRSADSGSRPARAASWPPIPGGVSPSASGGGTSSPGWRRPSRKRSCAPRCSATCDRWRATSRSGRALWEWVCERAPSRILFLRHMAKSALERPAPLGFFGGFVVERSGAHRHQLDLKARGVFPDHPGHADIRPVPRGAGHEHARSPRGGGRPRTVHRLRGRRGIRRLRGHGAPAAPPPARVPRRPA